jgi:hypothetical protein
VFLLWRRRVVVGETGLDGPDMGIVGGCLDEDNLKYVLEEWDILYMMGGRTYIIEMGVVQRLARIGLDGEVDCRGTLDGCIACIVDDWHQLRTTESPLLAHEDGVVTGKHLVSLLFFLSIELTRRNAGPLT